MDDLRDAACLVTGATSGIGLEYARALARRGAALLLTGRRAELLEKRAAELTASGASAVETLVGLLEDEAVLEQLLEAMTELGNRKRLAVVVNNAGFGSYGTLAQTMERSVQMLRVHAEAPLRTTAQAISLMSRHRRGLIVNVGSLAGKAAVPGSATYVATKIFLERLSETVALEAAAEGIVVQGLTPGYVRTEFHRDVEDYQNRRVNRGLIRWLDPDAVVAKSLFAARRAERRLARGKRPRAQDTVVVPGFANRILALLAPLIPRTIVYRAAENRKPM